MLGLGLVLAAICSCGQTDQRVNVTQILDKLLASLQDSSGQGRMLQEVQMFYTTLTKSPVFTINQVIQTH